MAVGRKKTAAFPWRQDFRDPSLLPDIKIVRTHFLYNFLAVVFLVVAVGGAIYQQYLISVRATTLAELETTILTGSPADKRNQADSARFVRDIQKVEEAAAFPDFSFKPELFVAQLSKFQPDEGCLKSFDMYCVRPQNGDTTFNVTISGTMSAGKEKSAPEIIGTFLDNLNADSDFWNGVGHKADLANANPVLGMNLFNYSIRLTLSLPASSDKKGKGAK
jgi:hypothetical protein